jgi:hypothetical protein
MLESRVWVQTIGEREERNFMREERNERYELKMVQPISIQTYPDRLVSRPDMPK